MSDASAPVVVPEAATRLAQEAKAFHFQLARAFARGKLPGLPERLAAAEATYAAVFAALDRALAVG